MTDPRTVPPHAAPVRADIHRFLHPNGVAIIGGLDRSLDAAATRRRYDPLYGADNWHLVSPKGGVVGDGPDAIAVHTSLADVPGPIDLAVLSTPPAASASVIEEVGARGIPFALVFSSGFSEVGGEGVALEAALADAGRRNGVRIFGPNTNTNAFEAQPELPGYRYGKIGLVTQSGHNGRPIVQGSSVGIAFSRQVPCGNEVDLDVCDFIEYYATDPDTAVIAGYIEGFHSIEKLRSALAACNAAGKPVVLLKIGSTQAGARMAASHTGHLTGADAVIDGLFRQYGVVRVRDLDELLETAALLAKLPPDTGPNLALYSVSGGSGTLMAEQAELAGLELPRLSDATQEALYEILPRYLTMANPVDNGGQFPVRAPAEERQKVLQIILDDPSIDVLVVGVTGAVGAMSDNICEDALAMARAGLSKPVVVTWNSPKTDEPGYEMLVESQLPMFRSFRNCFGALALFNEARTRHETLRTRPSNALDAVPDAAVAALDGAGSGVLDAQRTRALLDAFAVPMVGERTVTTAAQATATALEIGLPVAMKIASADFPHKSDAGLVRLGVSSAEDAERVFTELVERARSLDANATIDGVLLQQMVDDGVETIIGISRDPVLGHALLVGMGGIFTEVFHDTAVAPLPVDEADVWEMVRSLAGFSLLDGARGRDKVDVAAFVAAALAVAGLAATLGDRLVELDCNPVLVRRTGALAVDALVVLVVLE
jgi:acyl-CoA synthetase (NDP forming)